jgi:hypothetical protein
MRNLMAAILAGVLSILVAGCASNGKSSMPCEKCTYAVPDKKSSPPKAVCVVDGKQVDCTANPAACPGCKK